jgi:hypothetical protein
LGLNFGVNLRGQAIDSWPFSNFTLPRIPMYDAAQKPWDGSIRMGRPNHIAGEAELCIWEAITAKLNNGPQWDDDSFDFGLLFRSLQSLSCEWTRKHVSDWIYNHQLHTKPFWDAKILRLCPEKPPRLAAPPPPMHQYLSSSGQVNQPDIPVARSDSTGYGPDWMSGDRLAPIRAAYYLRDDTEETEAKRALVVVEEITGYVIESMKPPYVCGDLQRGDRDLFEFISKFVYERLKEGFESLVDELKSQKLDEMEAIWNASHHREAKLQQLEAMRIRKAAIQQERKEHFGKGANNLLKYRQKLAEQCTQDIREGIADFPDPDEETDHTDLPAAQATVNDDTVLDSLRANDQEYEDSPGLRAAFLAEQLKLSEVPPDHFRQVRWDEYPISSDLAFLLSAVSERALLIGKVFARLPCPRTVFSHYSEELRGIEHQLMDPEKQKTQIGEFIKRNGWTKKPGDPDIRPEPLISVSCDAAAMNPDGSYLPAEKSKYAFVVYGQPLDRRHHCMPLHVINAKSGSASETVQDRIDTLCTELELAGIGVKYICSDGDAGYNTRHAEFFDKWYPEFAVNGLKEALKVVARERRIPVSDFLHLWKQFLARVKNHPLALSPDSLDHLLRGDRFEEILELGSALHDKSAVGKMRDSYALQFFSLKNCIKCLHEEQLTEFMYLLPFTLQADVIRNPDMPRDERLAKAILSFRLLNHYFDLCCGKHYPTVHGRYCARRGTEAVSFAENAAWPRILNSSIALIEFILDADENWSFSRLGSHCLENFFGFIRQNARGDDRIGRAMHIIAKTQMVCRVMNDLEITMEHRGRDNVGGVVIGGGPIPFEELSQSVQLLESLIELSSLACTDPTRDDLLTLPQVTEQFILKWAGEADDPHVAAPDPTPSSLSTKNWRIMPRITNAQRAFHRTTGMLK